jgi:transposase
MEFPTIFKNVIGLDVHQSMLVATAITEDSEGLVTTVTKEFEAFKVGLVDLAQWCCQFNPDLVVMESTGIYWITPYRVLSEFGLKTYVVNARHVKNVPGKKTDVADSHWLAHLTRAGLLNNSYIPSSDLYDIEVSFQD